MFNCLNLKRREIVNEVNRRSCAVSGPIRNIQGNDKRGKESPQNHSFRRKEIKMNKETIRIGQSTKSYSTYTTSEISITEMEFREVT